MNEKREIQDYCFRDANVDDFGDIRKFLVFAKNCLLGPERRHNICVENFFRHYATYRLIATEGDNPSKIIGYAEFANYPLLFALPGEHWMDFLKTFYCLTLPISVTNTLFLNYSTTIDDPKLLKRYCEEIFLREPHLKYILVIEPPDGRLLEYFEKSRRVWDRLNYYLLEGFSQTFYPRCFSIENCRNTQKLHVIKKDDVVPVMTYRKALPEDNDDIIEVIDVDRPDLRLEFGDYFIAEELLRTDVQHNMLVVIEIDNQTAGFIWLNDDVDIILLLENYEVDVFSDLIKYNPKKRTRESIIRVVALENKPPEKLFTAEAMLEPNEFEFDNMNLFDQDDVSTMVLNSYNQCNLISIDGVIISPNDRYFNRQKFLGILQHVSYRLRCNAHYSYRFDKNLELCYNAPAEKEMTQNAADGGGDGNADVDAADVSHNDGDESSNLAIEPCPDSFNVLALQLFGMHRSHDMRRVFRVMMAAFAAYPDRDYCVISLPIGTVMTENLRFLLKYFVRMSPRPCCRLTDELYLSHRSSISGEISLHNVRAEDLPGIEKILHYNISYIYDDNLSDGYLVQQRNSCGSTTYNDMEAPIVNSILEDILQNPYSEYTAKTIRCGRSDQPIEKNILVGFVILRPFRYLHLLDAHFLTPKCNHMPVERAEIVTLRLHPFYHHQYGTVFRELNRLNEYYEFYFIEAMKNTAKSLTNDLVLSMQPVEPRAYKKISKAIPSYSPEDGEPDENDFYRRVNYVTDFFAVYYHNLSYVERCGSDTPLVIIGFSPICKAFLRSYIFNWNISSANNPNKCSCVPKLKVLVITEPGIIQAEYDKELHCGICEENGLTCYIDGCNWSDYVADVTRRMDIRKYIQYASGNIKCINRDTRNVVFDNGCQIYYEKLLLLCDQSFGCPRTVGITDPLPPNYIEINNRLDRIAAYHKVSYLRDNLRTIKRPSVVVYGAHLRTFEFINFLLEHGISSSMIKLVIPHQKSIFISEAIYNQPVADEPLEIILHKMVSDLNIIVYDNTTFSHWICYDYDPNISSVVFIKPNGEKIEFEVDLFASFYETYICTKFAEVLRQAGIKMDHRNIIVDSDFRTNDPSIYALGNYIQHKVEVNHQYKFVSHKEAAEKLLYKLGLLPAQLQAAFDQKFFEPHSCEVVLPMRNRLFKAVQPKRYLMNHLENEYTHSMVTFNGAFSRIRLNSFGVVEEIVVVTQEDMSLQFLLHFLGRHESLLNNLRARYCYEEIKSFVDFFQESWTEIIMHEDFHQLLAKNREILMPKAQEYTDLNYTRQQRVRSFKIRAQRLDLQKKLEAAFLDFVRAHIREFHRRVALPEDFHKIE